MSFFDITSPVQTFIFEPFEVYKQNMEPIENLTIASDDYKNIFSGASLLIGHAIGSVVLSATSVNWIS